ncbi:MAG: hypothetical protein EBS22_08800 [Acidimicrobiia bacterium]|nr:hypothetical protein [Acidimicrobiia bacterium]
MTIADRTDEIVVQITMSRRLRTTNLEAIGAVANQSATPTNPPNTIDITSSFSGIPSRGRG